MLVRRQDLEVQKAELEKAVKLSESKKLELETALAQTNQNLSHVNAERLTLRNELEKMTKETGQIKSQLQTAQLQLESFQAERPQVEIQKKYQVSYHSALTDITRLFQEDLFLYCLLKLLMLFFCTYSFF